MSDFNWNVAPSDHTTREFGIVLKAVKGATRAEAMRFNFSGDERTLRQFIWSNRGNAADGLVRVHIDKNNFIAIYLRWREEVLPSIAVDWELLKKGNILDGGFYLADLLSRENESLLEKLFVLLKSDHYVLRKRIDGFGLPTSAQVVF